jgi:hypothetical protein
MSITPVGKSDGVFGFIFLYGIYNYNLNFNVTNCVFMGLYILFNYIY